MPSSTHSLAGRVLDIHDDPNASLLKQAADEGLVPPLYVLTHRLQQDTQALPDELFAYVDPHSSVRKYACDSKATTWTNTLYFLKQGGVLPPKVQQQIATKLAHFHEIYEVPCPDLLTKVAAAAAVVPVEYQDEPESVSENLFALSATVPEPRYPIVEWDHIKKACDYFEYNWRVMPIPQRREFATKVAARVRELGGQFAQHFHLDSPHGIIGKEESRAHISQAPALAKVAALEIKRGKDPACRLPEMMELYASEMPCDLRIANAMSERIQTMERRNQQELAGVYRDLYDNRGSFTVDKFAEALGRIDQASGLSDLYGKRLLDPYLSILKIAEDPMGEAAYSGGGITLSHEDLQRLVSMKDVLMQHFDPGMVEELVADPEAVFPSLPDPEKQAIAALLQ